MAISAARLVVEVGADTSAAELLDIFRQNRATASMAMAGAGLTAGVTLPILAMGKEIIGIGLSYESAFAGVTKTVSGTAAEMTALSDGIRDMAMNMPASVESIAAVAEAAGALGIAKENILDFTSVMIDLGETTNMTSDQAASDLARFANITGMAQTDFDRLGSSIVALGNDGASTEAEIVSMAMRIAAAGKTIGMSEADILAWASAMSSLGIESEAGGTAISRVMIDIAQATSLGGKKLDKFADVAGVSSEAFRELFAEDATAALQLFLGGLGGIDEAGGNLFQTLEDLEFADVRVRDTLLRLAGAGDLVTDSIDTSNQAWEENIALSKEAG
ncbi:MAG: phage tail tape measure protein, partial [Rhodanobacter sp.]